MNAPADISIVNVHEAKMHFSRLLDPAHAGEKIVLAKAGVPYARMAPMLAPAKQTRKPGPLERSGGPYPGFGVVRSNA